MLSLILFIIVGIMLWILSLFYEIEFINILILSMLTATLVSVPYYSNKILHELQKYKNDNNKKE